MAFDTYDSSDDFSDDQQSAMDVQPLTVSAPKKPVVQQESAMDVQPLTPAPEVKDQGILDHLQSMWEGIKASTAPIPTPFGNVSAGDVAKATGQFGSRALEMINSSPAMEGAIATQHIHDVPPSTADIRMKTPGEVTQDIIDPFGGGIDPLKGAPGNVGNLIPIGQAYQDIKNRNIGGLAMDVGMGAMFLHGMGGEPEIPSTEEPPINVHPDASSASAMDVQPLLPGSQLTRPFEQTAEGFPPQPTPPPAEPVQGDVFSNITDETQPSLNFGPYRGVRGQFTTEPLPFMRPGETQPNLPFDPSQSYQGVLRTSPFEPGNPLPESGRINMGPTPTMADFAPVTPETPIKTAFPETVSAKGFQPDDVKFWRDKGYKSVPGLKDPEGYPMMVRGDINPADAMRAQAAAGPIPEGTQIAPPDEPQAMRIPGVREGNTGLENVAMGGADPRVLDVLGSSLYSRERPVTTMKELLQNAFDEHKQAGITEPVRVLVDNKAPNPIDSNGPDGRSITVRDRGRGLTPDQIYTVLTDMGKTGKAGVESAAGGFGFAKAAPFLGGEHTTVSSVVDTPKGRIRYTFKGTPTELKNQARGVGLNAEKVGNTTPTGLEVSTFYGKDVRGFYNAADWARNMTERSPSVESGIKLAEGYGTSPQGARRWLDETSATPIRPGEYNYLKDLTTEHKPQPMPTLMDTINVPGANVNIHYDVNPGLETSQADIHLMNKGMYQGTDQISYGEKTGNVPKSIVADINATVEEGHQDYPFSANREQINQNVKEAINKWVDENIVSGVQRKRVAAIQRQYDKIGLLDANNMDHEINYYDEGNRLTLDELNTISNNPVMNAGLTALEKVHQQMLKVADSLGWNPVNFSSTWKLPSQRLQKFGLLFEGPGTDGNTTMGIHIPRPDDMNNSAILINLMEHLKTAEAHSNPIDKLTTDLFTTLAHEQAHIPGGSHDKGFAYRDAQLRSELGKMNTVGWLDELGKAFDDGTGKINPAVSDLLQIYNESRQRPARGDDAVLATGISSTRSTDITGGKETGTTGAGPSEDESKSVGVWQRIKETTGIGGTPPRELTPEEDATQKAKASTAFIDEALGMAKSASTIGHFAATRQVMSQVATPEFWEGLPKAVKAAFSSEFDEVVNNAIKSKEIFQRTMNPETGETNPSYADRVGFKLLGKGKDLSTRTEQIASNWLENGRFFGVPDNPVSKGYAATYGQIAKGSTRAFRTMINYVGANRFEYLLNRARDMAIEGLETGSTRPGLFRQNVTPEQAMDLNPYNNLVLGRAISDFVRTATGQAPLKFQVLPYRGAEINLESSAKALTRVLFAPRSLFTKFRMLNPNTYIMAPPMVRMQYMKAALSSAGAWFAMTKMMQMAANASGVNANVSWDPRSSDFGKVRIGNTRLDFGQGYLPFLVSAYRLYSGQYKSSGSGKVGTYGVGFNAPTQFGQIGRTLVGDKLEPFTAFATDLAAATQHQPFHVGDRTLQLFTPMAASSAYQILNSDPSILPWAVPTLLSGAAVQTYGKGVDTPKFIPTQHDWVVTKPAVKSLLPWNY